MGKIKIGLALGSGAAKGFAHIGVLQALEENDINIDVVAGSSMGSVIGGLYSAGLTVKQIVDFATYFGKRKLPFWMDPSFFRGGGLLKGSKIEDALKDLTGPLTFNELKIPFFAVATDLVSGKEVVISEGDFHKAVRASISIPGVFSPVSSEKHWLVDGAVVTPIPTQILRNEGCSIIIGVDVGKLGEEDEAMITLEDSPSILDVLMQTLSISQQSLSVSCMQLADIKIEPEVSKYKWTDFSHVDGLIEKGYQATMEQMTHIKRMISRKSGMLGRLFSK